MFPKANIGEYIGGMSPYMEGTRERRRGNDAPQALTRLVATVTLL